MWMAGLMSGHGLGGGDHLGLAGAARGMGDLALQVGEIDVVRVGDADGAYAGGCEVEGERRAQPTGTGDEHARCSELCLAESADFIEQDMACVSRYLVFREIQVHRGALKT